jgi:predicted RNase H-like nuclease (RuvC/YqgF family)
MESGIEIKKEDMEIFAKHLLLPITVLIVGVVITAIVKMINWGIKNWMVNMDQKLTGYHKSITASFKEIKADFAELNKKVSGLENQLANLTSSNQEVSFRVSSLQDKFDTQTLEFNRDIKKLSEDNKEYYRHLHDCERSVLLLKKFHEQHHKDDHFNL